MMKSVWEREVFPCRCLVNIIRFEMRAIDFENISNSFIYKIFVINCPTKKKKTNKNNFPTSLLSISKYLIYKMLNYKHRSASYTPNNYRTTINSHHYFKRIKLVLVIEHLLYYVQYNTSVSSYFF